MLGSFPPTTNYALWENSWQKRELSLRSFNPLPLSSPLSYGNTDCRRMWPSRSKDYNLVGDIKKCVCMTKLLFQMTILPGRKKNSISFWSREKERERDGETATQTKLIALCSVIDEKQVIWYTWTVDSLILKKKTLNNTWIMHLSIVEIQSCCDMYRKRDWRCMVKCM